MNTKMEVIKTKLDGVYIIKTQKFFDIRGEFIKTYNSDLFNNFGLDMDFKEQIYTVSNKNVIRGMHFQIPPHDHIKLVSAIKGKVEDVILDLRKSSSTYGNSISVELSEYNKDAVYIPKGFAHGYKVIEQGSIVLYNVSTVYNSECDKGVLWNSFGFEWGIDNPILSERDKSFVEFKNFKSPF